MADARPSLEVEERPERGSRETRRLRRAGYVPGILYGGTHMEGVAFKVGAVPLRRLLVKGPALFDVKVGDQKAVPVILKDQQNHPVRNEVLHLDLLEVNLREKIQSPVSVELVGGDESVGVSEGGVLEHVTRELQIEALPTDIPEQITVDVSGLEIAGTLTLAEVTAPEGVEFLDDLQETVIATVVVPTEVPEEPEVEEETELIGEEGEAAEGEGAAEGEDTQDSGGDAEPDSDDS